MKKDAKNELPPMRSATVLSILTTAVVPSLGTCLTSAEHGVERLDLTGTNTYGGGTVVLDGTLIVTNAEGLADMSSLTVRDPSMFTTLVVPALAVAHVPEPGTLALFSAAVYGAAVYRRLRSRRKKQ